MSWIVSLIIGGVVGWLASIVMKTDAQMGWIANVVVGVVRNFTDKHPEGLTRVLILGDATRELGALSEGECRRVIAALNLAEQSRSPDVADRRFAGLLKAMNLSVAPLSCADTDAADPFGNPLLIDLRDADGHPLPAERWPLVRALQRHELVREEMLVRRRSGELAPVAISAAPVREGPGGAEGLPANTGRSAGAFGRDEPSPSTDHLTAGAPAACGAARQT